MTKPNTHLRSLALTAVLSLGGATIWGIIVGIGFELVGWLMFSGVPQESILVLRDGTPIVEVRNADNSHVAQSYHTLDGKPVPLAAAEWNKRADPSQLRGPQWRREPFSGIPPWSSRVFKNLHGRPEQQRWYFVHDGRLVGHGYFVGYDLRDRLLVGYLGRNGLRPTMPPEDEQFPVDGRRVEDYHGPIIDWQDNQSHHLLTEDGLVAVDLRRHTARLLYKNSDIVSGTPFVRLSRNDRRVLGVGFAIRDSRQIYLIDKDGKELKTYPLPESLRSVSLDFYYLYDASVLLKHEVVGPQGRSEQLDALDAEGRVTRVASIPLREDRRQQSQDHVTFAVMPCPALNALFLSTDGTSRLMRRSEITDYRTALGETWRKYWPGMLAVSLVSAVLAVLCYRRHRRYGLEWPMLWATLVFLFGVPAWLGYLVHRPWPARLPCPTCGQPTPRDREACLACGKPFPPPAPKGIEVFAS